jgi:hypothetical protein
MEGFAGGATIGKRLVNLVVVSVEGPMDVTKAFLRNISKIYWLFFLADWLIGFVTDGDPRQRYFDRFSNTTVVRTDVQEVFYGAYQPPGGPAPTPMPPGSPQPTQQQRYPQQQYQQSQPQQHPTQQTVPSQPAAGAQETAEPVAQKPGAVTHTRSELVALRKDDLIKIARDKGLKVSGTKRDLIDRIVGEGD